MLHGSTDPRNAIYDGNQVFIIDFDHARPSLNPGKFDYPQLSWWYGLQFNTSARERASMVHVAEAH
jgi:hypothetical protein